MRGPYPGELRMRVIGFVEARGSRREAAEQFEIGVSDEELGGVGVARVKRAVVIGIEHIEQRPHVRGGARVPVGEDDLVCLRQLPRAGRIEEQHAVAGARSFMPPLIVNESKDTNSVFGIYGQ